MLAIINYERPVGIEDSGLRTCGELVDEGKRLFVGHCGRMLLRGADNPGLIEVWRKRVSKQPELSQRDAAVM
jgi:hypothetical protein